uniref:Uncharacterized protein n=2 Tax=Meloidogyne TaxID=189290 RepID=A0A914L6P4_MELIC
MNLLINNLFKKSTHFNALLTNKSFFSLKPVQSIIFDLDGVIIDSETVYYRINENTLTHFGINYSLELKRGQMGRKLSEGVDYLLEATRLVERGVKPEDYLKVYKKFYKEELESTKGAGWPLLFGAQKLITHLHQNKIQIALCTGSSSKEFPKKIGKIRELIEKMSPIVLAGDDPEVNEGKPAPDPYLVTIRRMSLHHQTKNNNILVFEDSLNGVYSALSAGCRVCWIPQKQFYIPGELEELENKIRREDDENLFEGRINSLNEFIPEKYGLPKF